MMRRLLLLGLLFGWIGLTTIFAQESNFYLHENGVTVMCPNAEVGESGDVNGVTFTKRTRDQITNDNASTTCTSGITDMSGLFQNDRDFNSDISSWDVSNVTDLSSMFAVAGPSSFNQDISSWDVYNVTDMHEMFSGAQHFNQDISNWDVSNVTNMSGMFHTAGSFNQDISSWDVSNVTNMSFMFLQVFNFNYDIGSWDVSNVMDMRGMFISANSFDQDISRWDVSNVTNMSRMFHGATTFNQDLSSWDVSNVTRMSYMFRFAGSFNGDISSWDVSNVTRMSWMFENATTFNQDISNWDVANVIVMTQMFNGASTFNQNLSLWCVPNFSSEPNDFSTGSPLASEYHPQWGVCPGKPESITLSFPVNNTTKLTLTPTLEWLPDDDATVYQLQVFESTETTVIDTLTTERSVTITEELEGNKTYSWRVRGINEEVFNRTGDWSQNWNFTTEIVTSIAGEELPAELALRQNYPNPFNPTTMITFGLPESSSVQLAVYDMLGRRVAVLEDGMRNAGWHQVNFDASSLSSGIYIYRITAGEFVETRKMMLVK